MQDNAIACNTMQYPAIPCIINNCWRSGPLPCGQYNGHFYLPNCRTASCLCHKNVVFVLSSGDRQHHTADTARGWGLGWCDKNRSLQPSLPTGFQNTIFKIRNSVKWALELWTPYFELSLYHQSISPCHDNTSPVWDEVGTHVKHHFG